MSYDHPAPAQIVMRRYRQYILNRKRKDGTARGLIHYKRIVQCYLAAKREVIQQEKT